MGVSGFRYYSKVSREVVGGVRYGEVGARRFGEGGRGRLFGI